MRRMLCALTAALLSVPVTHADVLDQSQTLITSENYFVVGANAAGVQTVIGQVFTAGMDGYLERVQVYLENDSASPVTGGLLLSVQTVTADGLPSGREIASDSVGVCSASLVTSCVPAAGSPGWVEFGLPPAILYAGTRYALVLRAWGGGYLRWYDHIGPSAYAPGYMAGNTGTGWWKGDYDDMTFRTYVAPPALDQSQTVAVGYRTVQFQLPVTQTFTAGISGYLRRIRLLLENQTATTPVTVDLHTINRTDDLDEMFMGTHIAEATIPVASLPSAGSPGWVDVTFDYPSIVPGPEYAIILSIASNGSIRWHDTSASGYTRGRELIWEYIGMGFGVWAENWNADAAFETYVLRPVARSTPPPPREITPCANKVCPATKGGLTPANFVEEIKAHFLFKEKLNGTVAGVFSFTDAWPDGISFEDCTTEPGPCQLRVATFKCSGPNAMTVAGTLQRAADTYATSYELNLVGSRRGSGTITLKTPENTYTFTHDRIVEVICP